MDLKKIEEGVRIILEGIGEDVRRPGLRDTPKRVARMYEEIFAGLDGSAEVLLKPIKGESHDEMILVKDIPFFSVCEHHLVPFFGKAHIAYLPNEGRMVGLSKLARALELLAKRPQVQERLTSQLADMIVDNLKPKGAMVVINAEHLCMSMRGVKKPGSKTITSAVRGMFKTSTSTRAEMLDLMRGEGG
ncbi:MAG: GTP cyclohydrolase I FolE [Nitrospirae bacterium]|nr:GTP cyclohydrolase I FolE [Nitrospirota bacterium]